MKFGQTGARFDGAVLAKACVYAFCALFFSTLAGARMDAAAAALSRNVSTTAGALTICEAISLCVLAFVLAVEVFRIFAGRKGVSKRIFALFAVFCALYRGLAAMPQFGEAAFALTAADAYLAAALLLAAGVKFASKDSGNDDAK